MFEFQEFAKIPRLNRAVTITEKIDGTNAQIYVQLANDLRNEDCEFEYKLPEGVIRYTHTDGAEFIIQAGSRSRWLSEKQDNYGFWGWVNRNKEELFKLDPGRHFGEWFGLGIQRRYGLGEKRFALFNTSRWTAETLPTCCHVVPVVMQGTDSDGFSIVGAALEKLRAEGSLAAPGFMQPEGIVVFHGASRSLFKVTLDNDGIPKGRIQS